MIFDYWRCSKLNLLSETPSFLEFVVDFLFFISYKSVWMRLSNLGSVKSELLSVMLNLFDALDYLPDIFDVLCSLRVFCPD